MFNYLSLPTAPHPPLTRQQPPSAPPAACTAISSLFRRASNRPGSRCPLLYSASHRVSAAVARRRPDRLAATADWTLSGSGVVCRRPWKLWLVYQRHSMFLRRRPTYATLRLRPVQACLAAALPRCNGVVVTVTTNCRPEGAAGRAPIVYVGGRAATPAVDRLPARGRCRRRASNAPQPRGRRSRISNHRSVVLAPSAGAVVDRDSRDSQTGSRRIFESACQP